MAFQSVTPFPPRRRIPEQVSFDRRELSEVMSLYGRMVAAGEWRDYSICCRRHSAVFAVFRQTAETPVYRIEKRAKMRAGGAQVYAVLGADGRVLKRGADLRAVLRILGRELIRPVG